MMQYLWIKRKGHTSWLVVAPSAKKAVHILYTKGYRINSTGLVKIPDVIAVGKPRFIDCADPTN